MREDEWKFRRTHKFFMSTNHLPEVSGTDHGIWRRIKLIPCTVDLSKRVKPVPDYHLQLVANEGPGILNRLLAGYRSYATDNRFDEPYVVTTAIKQYRTDEDQIGRFLDDCCVVSESVSTSAKSLFESYSAWSVAKPKSQKCFGEEMSRRFTKTRLSDASQWRMRDVRRR